MGPVTVLGTSFNKISISWAATWVLLLPRFFQGQQMKKQRLKKKKKKKPRDSKFAGPTGSLGMANKLTVTIIESENRVEVERW